MPTLNVENRTLFHGDNLPFLRGMNRETVHLIATDPPFNKNRDFHATPDRLGRNARFTDRWSWDRDVHEDWIDSIRDDWHAVWAVIEAARQSFGDDMGAYLCWLGVRIMEMHRVLREDGSIYLHIDHTAHAYVKAIMDAVFGSRNFRNEIVWFYKTGGVSRRWFGRKHDSILFYSKSANYTFNPQKEKSYLAHEYGFSNVDIQEDERGFYTIVNMRDVWDIPAIRGNQAEAAGYPTQKPLALYERIIAASSNPQDTVLDPFCGCATTPVAAERLHRQWIGADVWDGAYETVLNRLQREFLDVPDTPRDRLFNLGAVNLQTTPPERTDDNAIAAPKLELRIQRPVEPWERITHRGMTNILARAQASNGDVVCAGCGRILERAFMELDHINPKSDRGANHIMNRILLCRPCNGRKRNNLTISGLMRANRQAGWMKDEARAQTAQASARHYAELTRDEFHSERIQNLIATAPTPTHLLL